MKKFLPISTVTIMAITMSACGSSISTASAVPSFTPTPIPSSTPTPIPLPIGRLIVGIGDSIYQLDQDSASKNINDLRIAGPNVRASVVSPDKRQLLYSIDDQGYGETRIRDLQTGEERILFSDVSDCPSWNTENSLFSYVGYEDKVEKLYVYSFSTGQSRLVDTQRSANYSITGTGEGSPVYSAIECAEWIGPDRLLFNRYVGGMPFQVDSLADIPADTVTLAILGEPVTLIDPPQKMLLHGVSADGTQMLIEQDDKFYLTQSFNDFESINLHAIDSSHPYFHKEWGFMPTDSDLYYTEPILEGVPSDSQMYIIDSETLQVRLGPKLPGDWNGWIWVGDPKDNVFAVADIRELRKNTFLDYFLIDLDTGVRTMLADGHLAEDLYLSLGPGRGSYILAWLPR